MLVILPLVIAVILSAQNVMAQSGATVTQSEQLSGKHRVELYVTDWCPWCKKAEAFFRKRGIEVTIYDVESDRQAAQRKAQLDSQRGVPFAVIDGTPIHGFSESLYRQALGEEE